MRILKLIGYVLLSIFIGFFIGKSLNSLFPLQEPKIDPILGAWYGEIHIDPPNSPSDPKPDNPDGTWNGFIGNDQVVRNSKKNLPIFMNEYYEPINKP
jgi:hypothetical protein